MQKPTLFDSPIQLDLKQKKPPSEIENTMCRLKQLTLQTSSKDHEKLKLQQNEDNLVNDNNNDAGTSRRFLN